MSSFRIDEINQHQSKNHEKINKNYNTLSFNTINLNSLRKNKDFCKDSDETIIDLLSESKKVEDISFYPCNESYSILYKQHSSGLIIESKKVIDNSQNKEQICSRVSTDCPVNIKVKSDKNNSLQIRRAKSMSCDCNCNIF
jgi:hypothetical protein